jgi:hypothetical protein
VKTLFENELKNFENSTLEDCAKLAFQNRFDTKFVLKVGGALDFLKNSSRDFSVLRIGDIKIQDYNTLYFDTPDLLCFNMHKNGRANRFKFRTRHYLSNAKIYNEIKKKLNNGKTLKFRRKRDFFNDKFDEEFEKLAKENGFELQNLLPSLAVRFDRITLLSKNFRERITLDFGLKYEFANKKIALSDTAIAEIKSEKRCERSFSREYFRQKRVTPGGFSKYCVGICLTNDFAKKNLFLPKIRKLAFESETKEFL